MDLAKLKESIAACPRVLPIDIRLHQIGTRGGEPVFEELSNPRYTKADVVPTKILCSNGDFAAFELASGKFGGIWPGHVDVVDTMKDLVAMLNHREKTLLEYGVMQ